MLRSLGNFWWLLVLRGVLALALGVMAFVVPGVTLAGLVLAFGAFALADGILSAIAAFRADDGEDRWPLALHGVLGVLVGGITLFAPGVTALGLVAFIAAWALVTGVLEIVAAIRLRKEIEGEFWMGLAGVASVIFGLLLLARPGAGALAILWMIAVFAIVVGIALILLGFRIRKASRKLVGVADALRAAPSQRR